MRISKSDLDLYYIVANGFNAFIPEDKITNGGNEKLMTAILRLFFKSLFVVISPSFHGLYNRTHGLTKLA